jgi:sigma-B regulation protein RsbU (phosphoserine phosphatase)
MMCEDWHAEDHLTGLPGSGLDSLPCYLALPLIADNRTRAIVQVFTTAEFLRHYDQELPVLTTLAAHAGTCLSNAVNYRELERQARMQGELDAARSILNHFTPSASPSIPRTQLHSLYSPAYEVGGDYIDYFQADNGRWVVAIADVCGKGVPAALFMVMLRGAFRTEAHSARSARELLCAVNRAMMSNLDDRSFVTAVCLMLDEDGRAMTYARAGHPMLVRIDPDGSPPREVPSNGLALGLVPDGDLFASMIDEVRIPLEKDARFLMYTDGLTEMTGGGQTQYGTGRLHRLLASLPPSGAKQMIDAIVADVKDFIGDAPMQDDLTILAMQVTG